MQPTLKDVAKLAGVSFTLVSKYLNRNPQARMTPETRERIDRAIAELGYRPSAAARSLRRGCTRTLGLVIGNLTNAYFAHFADAALREANAAGYQLLISLCGEEGVGAALQSLLDRQADAILLCNVHLDPADPAARQLRSRGTLPAVSDQQQEGIAGIHVDVKQPLRDAVALFRTRNHAAVTGLFFAHSDWPEEFRAACEANGLHPRIEIIPMEEEPRLDALRAVCRSAPGAIFTNGWQTTTMLLDLFETEFPDYHPEIVLHCNFAGPFLRDPHIAGVIHSSSRTLIREAVATLIARLDDPARPAADLRLPAEFLPRERFGDRLPIPARLSLT